MGQILPLAGAAIGAMSGGGPAGAAAGMQLGGQIGGALAQNDGQSSLSAAQRRIEAPEPTVQVDPVKDLEIARIEVASLPDEQRKEFEPPILAALMQARRGKAQQTPGGIA